MSFARMPLVRLTLACLLILTATSCTSTRPTRVPVSSIETTAEVPADAGAAPTPAEHTPSPPAPSALETPTRPATHPNAAPVVTRLAAQLLIAPEAISVVSVVQADWPDACLGLPADGEICAAMITPGYAVTVAVGQELYEFRTDATGEQIRVAAAPTPKTGDPLVTWRDSRSFTVMVVGTQRVAIGRRGRPLIAGPLAVPDRAAELQEFLARFAPFQVQTPAGEIALRGIGSSRASEADQRMIAEWARQVSLEARIGGEHATAAAALTWTRSGGIAGLCDTITVTRTGEAIASSCRGGKVVPIASVKLSTDELSSFYAWLDRLETFSTQVKEPGAVPDAMTTALEFRGAGIDEATDDERTKILAWVDSLALRLRETALR